MAPLASWSMPGTQLLAPRPLGRSFGCAPARVCNRRRADHPPRLVVQAAKGKKAGKKAYKASNKQQKSAPSKKQQEQSFEDRVVRQFMFTLSGVSKTLPDSGQRGACTQVAEGVPLHKAVRTLLRGPFLSGRCAGLLSREEGTGQHQPVLLPGREDRHRGEKWQRCARRAVAAVYPSVTASRVSLFTAIRRQEHAAQDHGGRRQRVRGPVAAQPEHQRGLPAAGAPLDGPDGERRDRRGRRQGPEGDRGLDRPLPEAGRGTAPWMHSRIPRAGSNACRHAQPVAVTLLVRCETRRRARSSTR
eukprot:scaffold874_cov380-Prasinococcus_capsulatus_cf.AAC.7